VYAVGNKVVALVPEITDELRPTSSDTAKSTRNNMKSICATSATAAEAPLKPKSAAMIANKKKVIAQLSTSTSFPMARRTRKRAAAERRC
jgi:hypothetical protein